MKEKLKQIFDLRCDCYSTMVMQSAMTSDKFIEVVSELKKPTDNEEMTSNELFKRLNSLPNYHAKDIRMKLKDGGLSIGEMSITTQPNPTWIEIKSEDDLPKDDGIYLIDCEHGVTMAEFSRYGNGNTSWWAVTAIGTYEESEGAKKVTAWMPLPTHPQTTTK